MSLLIIIACIYGICKLLSVASARAKEKARQAQIERIRREQERVREEQKRQREAIRAAQAAERERVRQMAQIEREQAKQRAEQERLAKEQAKQEVQIAKHEKRIADLEFKSEQASADIEHLRVVLDDLNESFELACQMADKAHNAGDTKREEQAKNKVIALRNKIHSAESRLAKAQHTKELCEMQMSA